MLENLVTPVVAVAILLGITLPIWFLVLLVRLVHNVVRIADSLEDIYLSECGARGVNVTMRALAAK